MLHYSFSTVLMTVLANNLLMLLLTFIFQRSKLMIKVGYRLLAVFTCFTVLRFLLPFEFPFAVRKPFPELISRGIVFIGNKRFNMDGFRFSLWQIFEVVWIIGILVGLFVYIRDYIRISRYISAYGIDVSHKPEIHSVIQDICKGKQKSVSFQIMELSGLAAPMIFGIRKPCVLLPSLESIPKEDLYFILQHETMHYFHHDLFFKSFIKFLAIIYWWNPASFILNRQVNVLLEMHVDSTLTKNDSTITEQYLQCILRLLKSSGSQQASIPKYIASAPLTFCSEKVSDMNKRFQMLTYSKKQNRSNTLNITIFIFVLGIYLLSYLYIFEPWYIPPEIEQTTFHLTEENSYFIENGKDRYDVYYNGKYIETIDDPENYIDGIKIYNAKGELIDEN